MLYEMRLVGLAMDPFSNSPIVILRDKHSAEAEEEKEAAEELDIFTEPVETEESLLDFEDGESESPKKSEDVPEANQDEHILPIWIGESEANAIATELLGIVPPRPMTHDLLRELIASMGGFVRRVIVTDIRDNTFFATIELQVESGDVMSIDSRPSDALALALRCKAAIFVDARVLEKTQKGQQDPANPEGPPRNLEREFYEEVKDEWQDVLDTLAKDSLDKYEQ